MVTIEWAADDKTKAISLTNNKSLEKFTKPKQEKTKPIYNIN
jgi:hypothetical protein